MDTTLFPAIIIAYIGHFAPYFPANNFIYFRAMMLAYMLLGQARKCVTNIASVSFFVERHISSWERFISQHQWDLSSVKKRLVTLLMEQLGDKLLIYGGYLACVDTTFATKVQGEMPGVQKWHDHSSNPDRGEHLIGHHWAIVALVGTTTLAGKWTILCFPLLANLISGTTNSIGFFVNPQGVAQVMDFWSSVCPLVAQLFEMMGRHPMRVVADAYFSKATFINWMLSLPVHVITRMRKDAVGWDSPKQKRLQPNGKKKKGPKPKRGKKWKIASLIKNFPLETVTVFIYGKVQTLHVVTRYLWIRGVESQKVKVVVIKTQKEPIILLSTDLSLSAREIIHIYAMRFSLEIGIRDAKQHFGFTHYQSTGFLGITRSVALCLVSFCLWRLTALKEMNADWLKEQKASSALSFHKISRAMRQMVIQRIFENSASTAEFQNSTTVPKEIPRMVA